jgi:glycosyltransferase involved in cell wall biosynthesis
MESPHLKILLVHNSYRQRGGEDIAVQQEYELLKQHGHDVTVYRRSNHEIENLSLIERMGLIGRMISASDAKREVLDILRELNADLVHVHNTFMMISPAVYQACSEAGVPVVQTLHNYRLLCPGATFYRDGQVCEECMVHGLLRSVRHGCYRNSHLMTAAVALMLRTHRERAIWDTDVDTYLAPTEFARQKFIGGGLPAEKIYVKPNFVDMDPGVRTYRGHYALFVGRLSEEKGLPTLLDAWKHLQGVVPLVIVGEGPLRSQLELEIEKRNLSNIRFTGWLKRDEVRTAMKEAAFLVFPSTWYETFGMTLAEAFACGTPALGSRLGAVQEIIDDGTTGMHFTAGDAGDLAEKAAWAWQHASEMEAMGKACRRAYETHYTAENNYSLLMKIYRTTIEHYGKKSAAISNSN